MVDGVTHESEKLIAENAERLISDSQLLFDHDRFASAFALAVLALEELGKIQLKRWATHTDVRNDTKRYGYHQIKQAVVGALCLAEELVDSYKEFLSSNGFDLRHKSEITPGQLAQSKQDAAKIKEAATEHMVRFLNESPHDRFFELSFFGSIDKTKQAALYVDDFFLSFDISPFKFSRADAESMIDRARKAAGLMDHPLVPTVAKAIYRVRLEDSRRS